MKRTLGVGCAVVAMLGLTAAKCTPEQIEAVAADYRAKVEAESVPTGPAWSVVADCGGAHIKLTGWTGVTDVSPSTGKAYVLLGLGGTNFGIDLDETGSVDRYIPADQGTANTSAWPWSIVVNGEPNLSVTGIADC